MNEQAFPYLEHIWTIVEHQGQWGETLPWAGFWTTREDVEREIQEYVEQNMEFGEEWKLEPLPKRTQTWDDGRKIEWFHVVGEVLEGWEFAIVTHITGSGL